jgi:hypothetical protein
VVHTTEAVEVFGAGAILYQNLNQVFLISSISSHQGSLELSSNHFLSFHNNIHLDGLLQLNNQ